MQRIASKTNFVFVFSFQPTKNLAWYFYTLNVQFVDQIVHILSQNDVQSSILDVLEHAITSSSPRSTDWCEENIWERVMRRKCKLRENKRNPRRRLLSPSPPVHYNQLRRHKKRAEWRYNQNITKYLQIFWDNVNCRNWRNIIFGVFGCLWRRYENIREFAGSAIAPVQCWSSFNPELQCPAIQGTAQIGSALSSEHNLDFNLNHTHMENYWIWLMSKITSITWKRTMNVWGRGYASTWQN